MSKPIKPIIDKSKLLAIARNVTKSKLINKNNNIPNQPIKVHIRTDSGLLYNDISLSKEKTKLINARLQKEIAGLKEEKKQLQDLLMALQRKITDLEAQAGIINGIPNHTV